MTVPAHVCHVAHQPGAGFVAIAPLRLTTLASAESFLDAQGAGEQAAAVTRARAARGRWCEVIASLCATPPPTEFLVEWGRAADGSVFHQLAVVARAEDEAAARGLCLTRLATLRGLLERCVPYARFEPTSAWTPPPDGGEDAHVIEFARSVAPVAIGRASGPSKSVGFAPDVGKDGVAEFSVRQLHPWAPSDDDGGRLWLALSEVAPGTSFVSHVETHLRAPSAARAAAHQGLAALERLLDGSSGAPIDTLYRSKLEALRTTATERAFGLEGAGLAARHFARSPRPLREDLLATLARYLDGGLGTPAGAGPVGGVQRARVSAAEVLAPLDAPSVREIFEVAEATAFVRSPWPRNEPLPGVDILFARTAPVFGTGGGDAPIGTVRQGRGRTLVRLDDDARFRHTYVVGQTGTGKSTLLLHHILHDIRAGRGVAVLDPHGALIEAVLQHFPEERRDDLIMLDVTDPHYPVPFNPLRITAPDPFEYRLQRDLVIDDLYSYLDRTYDLQKVGGPIFESHFRGMLGLLIGVSPPASDWSPTLMMFRSLYANRELRQRLVRRIEHLDPVTRDFIREAEDATHDASMSSVAPYITSKFARFVSDMTLRNITCQREIIDMDTVVGEGKVLLCDLGRGRFGDQPAGLLASQIVSRIRSAVMRRGSSTATRPFYLYADEFQIFADERIGELLSEARKFRLAITLAHQFLGQLSEVVRTAVLGNVGTVVSLRVGPADAGTLAPLFEPALSARDLVSLPNHMAYVRSFGGLGQRGFSVDLPAPPRGENGHVADGLRAGARARYGRPRGVVEAEIRMTYDRWLRGELMVA